MIRKSITMLRFLSVLGVAMLMAASVPPAAQGQTVPSTPDRGFAVIAWHTIAANARTYALVQSRTGITQYEAVFLASRFRFRGKPGYLAEFGTRWDLPNSAAEWLNFRSRFGNSLRGQRQENAWVNARVASDGYVKWVVSDTKVENIRLWTDSNGTPRWGWAPNEPQAKTAVSLHAGYPGLFNSCSANDRYTRMLVEFR